jgi:hypothetical protein
MSAYCDPDSQNCSQSCCNALTKCPTSSADCYYYYDSRENDPLNSPAGTLSGGIIAAIVIGSIVLVVILVEPSP